MVERCNSVPNLGTQVIQPPGNTVVNWWGAGGGGQRVIQTIEGLGFASTRITRFALEKQEGRFVICSIASIPRPGH